MISLRQDHRVCKESKYRGSIIFIKQWSFLQISFKFIILTAWYSEQDYNYLLIVDMAGN